MKELPPQYDPGAVESKIYNMWMAQDYFKPRENSDKEPFTIVIPPPNVTGQLHLGHAFDETLQDVLIRYKRMNGYPALWVPGTDHAGIATQIKVEEALRDDEGVTRHDLGRQEFLSRVWSWKNKYGHRIIEQLKSLGCSCDWSRLRFTMDEGLSEAVREVFVSLYEKGMIYRGRRIINWCPECTTALSDAEVEHEEREGSLWHIRYPLSDGSGELIVATTRPETMLGDTAVAVHPDDERYKNLVHKAVLLPLCGREIPIVADEYVEKDFGTGCVKITPCHDPNDFEVARRHNLPELLIMDDNGNINQNGGRYAGLPRQDARAAVLGDLESGGYLVKSEKHIHNVGSCYRCHKTVEPLASLQWFVKMEPLAAPAMEAVREGKIRFVPERFSKMYMSWMENVRDWCISRQIWWGHRIPVWYCSDCGHETVSRQDVNACGKCQSSSVCQDEDVLDTWFSSALWPFSTLGWPRETEDMKSFYPTSVLVTAYDIIFFWVARMIFSGIEQTGKAPFHTVFMHGLLRDGNGKKMSKSAGNGIDPMEMVKTYGADALRVNIVTLGGSGNDLRFTPERCQAMRNFCNKLWNASRFVLMNLRELDDWSLPEALELPDKWILSRLNILIEEMSDRIEKYDLGMAVQKIYDFLWDDFCDWYIELSKPRLSSGDDPQHHQAQRVLRHVLEAALRLLHPFAPFITEEIWQSIPHQGTALIVADWPRCDKDLIFSKESADMESVMDCIRQVRSLRAEMKVPPSRVSGWTIVTQSAEVFSSGMSYFIKLGRASQVTVTDTPPQDTGGFVQAVTSSAVVYLPLTELVDVQAERARLTKELQKIEKDIASLGVKLQNPGFLNKAPQNVLEAEKSRLSDLVALKEKLLEGLERI